LEKGLLFRAVSVILYLKLMTHEREKSANIGRFFSFVWHRLKTNGQKDKQTDAGNRIWCIL